MTDSLRDQLLGLGFKPPPKPDTPVRRPDDGSHRRTRDPASTQQVRPAKQQGPPFDAGKRPRPTSQGAPRPRGNRDDIDLAKAYAIRAQREKDERMAAEKARQEEARLRREAKARLSLLVKDRALNATDADIARHFDYGGKIKRIHVTAAQLKSLNAGELGVVQMDGRYLLVDAKTLMEAEAIFAPAIALKVDAPAPAASDPYADPRYQVPDDLVW